MESNRELVFRCTAPATSAFIPELKLRLVTPASPLWRASEKTLNELSVEPPYWAYAWAGGLGLARFVLDNPDVVAGRRVLDFAAGCGLIGIAAAKAGAAHVRATEIDALAAEATTQNGQLNGVALDVVLADVVGDPCHGIDVVLAGDVFFETELARRCIDWFEDLASRGIRVFIGDPGRFYLPHRRMTERARYALPESPEIEDEGVRKSTVFEIEPA